MIRESRICSQPLFPQLSNELLPKEKWKPDDKVKKCDHCDRPFIYLIRRRHHCRRCGHLFCSDCSDNFLSGQLFSVQAEKQVRFCGRCYDHLSRVLKAQGYTVDDQLSGRGANEQLSRSLTDVQEQPILISSKSVNLPKSPTKDRESESAHSEHDTEFNPDIEQENIQLLFVPEETHKNKDTDFLRQQLKEKSYSELELICEYCLKSLLQKNEGIDQWKQLMTEFIKRAVEDVQFSSLNGDPMDINYYVKTKTIPYQDHSMTGYFKGVVFRKNVALKKMQSHLQRPKVMIIVGSLDMGEGATQFEDYISKERKAMMEYVEKIKENFKPNLLLIEKSANKIALDLLQKHGISVVQNIKSHLIRKIAKCTNAKFVKLEKLDDYILKKQPVLGSCENVVFRNFPKQQTEQQPQVFKDSTLLFLETKDGHNGVTITLSGPNDEILGKLKQCIVGCMRLAKHFDVERHMTLTELKLKGGKQQWNQAGDFTKFLFEKVPLKEIIKPDLAYVKINYVLADIHNFNDIKDLPTLQSYQKEYHSNKQKIVDFFAEMCNLPVEKSKALYHSSDDLSLGAFIILKVSNMDSRCEHCKLPRNSHVSIYYSGGKYIRISVDNQLMPQVPEQQSLRKQLSQQTSVDEEGKIFTHKDVAKILIQNHKNQMDDKKKIKIETYIECNLCMAVLTEIVSLNQLNLEYSFLRFLQHLFLAPIGSTVKKTICEHTQLQRVFRYEDCMVKVLIGEFEVYSTTLLNLGDGTLNEYHLKWEQSLIKHKKEELLIRVLTVSSQLINMIPKTLPKNEVELLSKTVKQLKEDFEKIINETQFNSMFLVEKVSQEYGISFRTINQTIMDHKKKKELNSDLKHIIQSQFNARTTQDLDRNTEITQSTLHTHSFGEKEAKQIIKSIPEYRQSMDQVNSNNQLDEPMQLSQKDDFNSSEQNSKQQQQELTDLLIPVLVGDQDCKSPLYPKLSISNNNPQSKNAQLSIRDLDKETIQQQTADKMEFNFLKEWNLCSFIAEQSKLIKGMQMFDYIPIYENQPLSYLAFAFNHQKYLTEIYHKENFNQYENQPKTNENVRTFFANQLAPRVEFKMDQSREIPLIERERGITMDQARPDKDTFVLRINYDQEKRIEKSPNLLAQSLQLKDSSYYGAQYDDERSTPNPGPAQPGQPGQSNNIQIKKSKYAEVLIYFPTQFEALRMYCGVQLSQFIKSISSTQSWSAQGGKSQSRFYKSNDELFIFKKLEQDKEFVMFKKFALDYFRHMHRHLSEGKPSLLSKIFGMFEIRDRGTIEYYLVMENLFFGMGDNLTVYDLKGSETNRWEKKKKGVLLDTNFRVDRNAEPIPILKENYRFNDRAFQSDCKFLNKQNVIDYSLLLIIDNKTLKLRMGIIDYLRFYTWDKETEHYLKYLLKGGMVPTIVNPADYKKRFIGAMQKYFIAV